VNHAAKPHLHAVPPPVAGRVPPNHLDAEAAVLSAILVAQGLDRVADRLTAEDFYSAANGRIYAAATALAASGTPVDSVTVGGYLRDRDELARVGGVEYLAMLCDATPSVQNLEAHAEMVIEKARVRRMIATCQAIVAEGYGDIGATTEDWLDGAEQAVCDAANTNTATTLEPVRVALAATYKRISDAAASGQKIVGTSTGLDALDAKTGGLHPGALTVIAARPGMGKSALATNIAANVARAGHGVAFFSLEMQRDEIAQRLLCSEARVSMERMRSGEVEQWEWPRVTKVAPEIAALPLWLDESSGVKPVDVRSRVRRLAAECERAGTSLRLVVIDYLQIMDPGLAAASRETTRDRDIGVITAMLKRLAKDNRVAVVVLSQLNRSVETRPGKNKRPMLSDLRESGNIEQDADNVLFVHREDYYDHESERRGVAELIIAKQRNGPTGTVLAKWTGVWARFDNLTDDETSAYWGNGEDS